MNIFSVRVGAAFAIAFSAIGSVSAAPNPVGTVYQEYKADTCSFGTCFVQFAALKKKLKLLNVSCYISHASAADLVINRIAVGDMKTAGDLTSFASAALIGPITKFNELKGQTTYQFNVPVLVGIDVRRIPAIYVEFTRDTASFLKCSIAGEYM